MLVPCEVEFNFGHDLAYITIATSILNVFVANIYIVICITSQIFEVNFVNLNQWYTNNIFL